MLAWRMLRRQQNDRYNRRKYEDRSHGAAEKHGPWKQVGGAYTARELRAAREEIGRSTAGTAREAGGHMAVSKRGTAMNSR